MLIHLNGIKDPVLGVGGGGLKKKYFPFGINLLKIEGGNKIPGMG